MLIFNIPLHIRLSFQNNTLFAGKLARIPYFTFGMEFAKFGTKIVKHVPGGYFLAGNQIRLKKWLKI